MTKVETLKAGYAPSITLMNFVGELAAKPDMLPPRIDVSIMRGMSGATQSQLLITLRFLVLVAGDDDRTTEAFAALVGMSERDRKTWFAEAVRRCYAEVMELSEDGGTSGQLAELFEDLYGYKGSTRDKAIRFYLQLAQYAGVKTSPHFAVPRATPKGSSAKRSRKDRQDPPTPPPADSVTKTTKTTKTIELRSGGTVTLSYDVDLFEVNDTDQEFVLGLIKELRAYEHQRALPAGDVPGQS